MNTMLKRLLSIVVSLTLVLSLIPWGAANVNAATNQVSAETLYSDSFDEDMALTDAGWNNNTNANIQNGTLNVSHTAASGNTAIYHGFEDIAKVTVEFDFTLNYEGEDDLSHAIIRLRSSGTNLLALIVRRHQMKVNTSWVNYGETWASGTTHKMKLVADAETDTCDVYVDGNLLKDDVALTGNADVVNQLVVGAQGNGSGTTGITVCYDNISVKCSSHVPGEWIVDTAASCVAAGSKYQSCTVCKTELNREEIPAGEHGAKDDGDCTTAVYCDGCGTQITAAQTAHKYADEFDTSCDNADCVATRKTAKTLLLRDDFNTDKALTEAGWNNNANANIQNGTLNITHTAASGNVAIFHGFDDVANVSVEFDFTLNYEGEDDTSHAMVRLRNSSTNQLVLIVKRHQMKVNTSWVDYSETLVSGTTHKMKIVAYAESGVCDIYLDEVPIADNVALTGDFDSINQLVLGAQGNGSGTTGMAVSYDDLLVYSGNVECNHIAGEWIVDAVANCVTNGSRYQACTICQAEVNRETIPAGGHAAEDDGDCTTAVYCAGCGTQITAAQAEHKYADEYDTTCDNANCTATREVEKTLLLRDDFNTDMTLTEAGWNNNANANIQNGSLNITHSAASGNVAIFHGFEDASNVSVEFDFTLNYEGDDDESHAMVRLRNSGTNLLVLVVRRHQMKIGDTWVNYGETWASGTTHTMKLVVNTDTDTCVMYVDGKMFKDDISLVADASSVNQIVLGAQNGEFATGITVSYDNLLAYSGGTECNHAWVGTDCTTPETCSVCYISKFFAPGHTFEKTVTQEPTYTVAGIMTYTCECGESYTEEIPVLASPVKQWNIALKEDIGLNFYLNLTDEQIQNSALTVTFNGTSNDVELAELPTSEEGYRVVSVDVAAAQMNDKVTLNLTIDGELITKEYSVRQYAEYIMDEANGFDDATKQVVLDMLHYGAAAQTYFGYNTEPLANDGYEDNTNGDVAANTSYTNVAIDSSVDDIRFYGASLLFQKNISVRYYFTVNEGVDLTSYTFTIGETAYEVQNNGMYYIQIDNIYPYDIDEPITVVISDGTSSMSVQYCPMNYVVRQYGKTENGNLKALLQQLFDYYVAVSNLNV